LKNLKVNESAAKLVILEVKLDMNQKLYDKGLITEEMYNRAKELIIKGKASA